jgi:hypothetical protein
MRKPIIAAALCVLLAACSGNAANSDSPSGAAATAQTQASTTTAKAPTARDLISGFKRAGLPVGKIVCYTDENDPNEMLGRPGGYVEKCDWSDKRHAEPDTTSTDPLDRELAEGRAEEDIDLIGGSIEKFETADAAADRAEYLKAFEGGGALSTGYTYNFEDSPLVLRIDTELTKTQAQAYHDALLAQL